jgi:WS/DGAT/MGAT family acyltransferase
MWLNMDRPNNLMIVEALLWCDEPVDWARLTAVVRDRLVGRYPVFGQRPVTSPWQLGRHQWEDDPDYSLARHLRRATLPPPGDEASLARYAESQMCRPLDRSHPLWELHLIDGFLGGSAVMARVHHALADGIAMAEVLLSLTDDHPSADLELSDLPTPVLATTKTSVLSRARRLPALREAARLSSALSSLARPSALRDALTLAEQTGHVADKLVLRSNPVTALSGTPGVEKRAVWSQALPVSAVRDIARAADATINDVLVGAVSAAIAGYLASPGEHTPDLTTMIPVNLRPADTPLPPELGNQFALVLLPMALSARGPMATLLETKRRMDRIKASPEALITFGLIGAIGQVHPWVERLVVDFFSSKAFGVTTNVIGPRTDRFLAGSRLAGVLGWVPGSGKQTLGVCIFTYNGTVRVGFKVDAGIVPDPELLVAAFEQEMDDLVHITRSTRQRRLTCLPTKQSGPSRSMPRTTTSSR